jgi:hypothetical protein
MTCTLCSGSGACDPCDGYGTLPDSYPNAGDGADCTVCDRSGICPNCTGTGTTTDHHHNDNDERARPGATLGVMT